MPEVIAVIGASGYIGRHLVLALTQVSYRIKVLSRNVSGKPHNVAWPAGIEVIQGSLNDPASLLVFFEEGCTVINLAYLWDAGEMANLSATSNMLCACKQAKVKRLIHCSTAAVVGRVPDNQISESTVCRPITEYGITKLKIEQMILDSGGWEGGTAILRPTAVFGPGGEPLKKLTNDLLNGSRIRNYLKSCLFGRRRMNLVHIANVVEAIQFLIKRPERLENELFIVSDDGDPKNNYLETEQFLMSFFGCQHYVLPRIMLPFGILSLLLRFLGRNNINPRCNFDSNKLHKLGFNSPVNLSEGLAEYASWYRASHPGGEEAKPS